MITVRLTETVIVVDRLLEVVIECVTLFVRVGQKVTSVRVCVILVVMDLVPEVHPDTVPTLDVARGDGLREIVVRSVMRVREGVIVGVKVLLIERLGLNVREVLVHAVRVTRAEAGTVGKLDGLKDGRRLTDRVGLNVREALVHPVGVLKAEAGTVGKGLTLLVLLSVTVRVGLRVREVLVHPVRVTSAEAGTVGKGVLEVLVHPVGVLKAEGRTVGNGLALRVLLRLVVLVGLLDRDRDVVLVGEIVLDGEIVLHRDIVLVTLMLRVTLPT